MRILRNLYLLMIPFFCMPSLAIEYGQTLELKTNMEPFGQPSGSPLSAHRPFFGATCYDGRTGNDRLCDIEWRMKDLLSPRSNELNGGHAHDGRGSDIGDIEFKGARGTVVKNTTLPFQPAKYGQPQASGVVWLQAYMSLTAKDVADGWRCADICFTPTSWLANIYVNVGVQDLTELSASEFYVRCAKTADCTNSDNIDTAHPKVFYGKPAFVDKVAQFAEGYYFFGSDSPDPTDFRKILFTDMSLPFGGLMDVNHDFKKPHTSHRKGTSIDAKREYLEAATGQLVFYDLETDEFKRIAKSYGLLVVPEVAPVCSSGTAARPCIHINNASN
jgi:hypothetical protein